MHDKLFFIVKSAVKKLPFFSFNPGVGWGRLFTKSRSKSMPTDDRDQDYDIAWSIFEANKTGCNVLTTSRGENGRCIFWVNSDDPSRYYPVLHERDGRFVCPCDFFKEYGLCAHTGAVNLYLKSLSLAERRKLLLTGSEQAPLYQKPVPAGISENPRDRGLPKRFLR